MPCSKTEVATEICKLKLESTAFASSVMPCFTVFDQYCLLINCVYVLMSESYEARPPLWSSRHSSWLQIQRSGFDSRRYQIFWEVICPFSLVSTTEELLERKSSGSGLERREYCRRDPTRWPRGALYLQKLALTSPTLGGRSVGIVRSRT
jgi:hypothetical protein